MKLPALLATLALASFTACALSLVDPRPTGWTSPEPKHTFAIGTNDFLLDGQRFQIRCGVELCMNLRLNRMTVGVSGFNPIEFNGIRKPAIRQIKPLNA